MFSVEELACIDSEYFNLVVVDSADITIQSKNTGHYWYLHCTEYPVQESCLIFHKHKYKHPYHKHGKARSLGQAIKGIKKHDQWIIKRNM